MKKVKSSKGCKEWREFKVKWDNNVPRQSTKAFKEYVEDAKVAEKALKIYCEA